MKKFLFLSILFFAACSLRADWKNIRPGLDYRNANNEQTHFFRIDPRRFRIGLLLATDLGAPSLPVHEYVEKTGVLLAINGGFFDELLHPLGLLRQGTNLRNPLRNVSWGVFFLGGREGRTPYIVSKEEWQPEVSKSEMFQNISMAIQVGPRLVINGSIPNFKDSAIAKRSAIGVTKDGWVEIAASDIPMTLQDWAKTLRGDCIQALNLDGGGSTQILSRISGATAKIQGLTTVPTAIGVFEN